MYEDNNCRISTTATVFAPINIGVIEKFQPGKSTKIPDSLQIGGLKLTPRTVKFKKTLLDVEKVIGGKGHGLGCMIYIPIEVAKDGEYTFGVGVDYWMDFYVDGQEYFTTGARHCNRRWSTIPAVLHVLRCKLSRRRSPPQRN